MKKETCALDIHAKAFSLWESGQDYSQPGFLPPHDSRMINSVGTTIEAACWSLNCSRMSSNCMANEAICRLGTFTVVRLGRIILAISILSIDTMAASSGTFTQ